jgi:predicted metal-dependent HD superfamily phosphohydrolase
MLRDTSWDEAVRAVRGDVHGLVSVREDLALRWSEAHRGYHDLRHLDEVIAALTELRDSALDTDEDWATVVLAAWFHDAVYDVAAPGSLDPENERRSAELGRDLLSRNGVGAAAVESVVSLIEASQAHDVSQTHGPQAAFHDADLWILGAPTRRFDEYCSAVRREYAAVPRDAYAQGRSAILGPFLTRNHVYRTDHARGHWETAARDNLERELGRLSLPS